MFVVEGKMAENKLVCYIHNPRQIKRKQLFSKLNFRKFQTRLQMILNQVQQIYSWYVLKKIDWRFFIQA